MSRAGRKICLSDLDMLVSDMGKKAETANVEGRAAAMKINHEETTLIPQSRLTDRLERMVREAGWSGIYTQWESPYERTSLTVPVTREQIVRFAEIVSSEEREACKKAVSAVDSRASPRRSGVKFLCVQAICDRSNVEVSGGCKPSAGL